MRSDLTSEAVVASESPFSFVVRTSDFFWKFLIFSESNGMIFSETKQIFHNEGYGSLQGHQKGPYQKISPSNGRHRSIRSVPCSCWKVPIQLYLTSVLFRLRTHISISYHHPPSITATTPRRHERLRRPSRHHRRCGREVKRRRFCLPGERATCCSAAAAAAAGAATERELNKDSNDLAGESATVPARLRVRGKGYLECILSTDL